MSDKKHIDRIFQEKFKELDATPDKAVWDKIQKELSGDKKNRKIIPFWWRYAGIAAGLLILLTVGNLILNNSNNIPEIVDKDEKVDTINIIKSSDIKIANTSNESDEKNSQVINNDEPILKPKSSINQETESIKKELVTNWDGSNSVTNTETSTTKEKYSDNFLVNNQNKKNSKGKNSNLKQPLNNIDNKAKEEFLNTNSEILSENIVDNQKITKDVDRKNIINDSANEQLVVDEEKEKIPLTEEVIVSNEDINEEEKETINRWQVYPNIAPVYFNSLGKGSSLDDQFINNPKTGELNTSYGVNVGYAINEKITLKTGFNALALSYDTDNVILYQNIGASQFPSASAFRNIEVEDTGITMISASNINALQVNSILGANSKAAISQRLNYFEIPLEVDYKLINKKVGVNLTGGFSTFFLRNNDVVSEFDGYNTYFGEATNINNVSYSLNFGFGIEFPFSKKMSFNIDPKFKYQVNTFKDTSGNFRPYIIGLYTGLNYKF